MSTSKDNIEPIVPQTGRLLGIDFGTVRIGIALCDENQSIASPLETYHRSSIDKDAKYFQDLVTEYSIVGFVVGLPLHMSGDESEKSTQAREFGRWLASATDRPVTWVDERYSTRFAQELLRSSNLSAKKRKAKLDKLAAQSILSVYLESAGSSTTNQSIDD